MTRPDQRPTDTQRQSTRHVPRLDHLRRHRDLALATLRALDDVTLADLHRRAGQPDERHAPLEAGAGLDHNDGYPSGAGVGHSTGVARPTETAALDDTIVHDPIGDALTALFAQLAEATGILRSVDQARTYILGVAAHAEGRQSSLQGDCQACGTVVEGVGSRKLASGYCPACRKAWERDGYPDRVQFERSRAARVQRSHADMSNGATIRDRR